MAVRFLFFLTSFVSSRSFEHQPSFFKNKSSKRIAFQDFTTFPNILTVIRLGLLPVILVLFFFHSPWMIWWRNTLFIVAAATDFLDGYIARLYKQTSRLGRILDPLADKILVVPPLVMLVLVEKIQGIHLLPFFLILIRELAVPNIREAYFETKGKPLKTHTVAQWKTTAEMCAIALLMVGDCGYGAPMFLLCTAGLVLLYMSAILGMISLWVYLKCLFK